MWIIQPLEIAGIDGKPTGRWRLTARSDEDGGGPFGDATHDHVSPEEALACEVCDIFTARISGFPPRLNQRDTFLLATVKALKARGYTEDQILQAMCDHEWTGQRQGGAPDSLESAEWVGYCAKCGIEGPDD